MSDHYCCKCCGLRYNDCCCVTKPLTPTIRTGFVTPVSSPPKPKVKRPPVKDVRAKHPSEFCSVRLEIVPVKAGSSKRSGTHYLRLVGRNGKILFHSESYSGGVSKSKLKAQALVDSWCAQEVLLNVFETGDLDEGSPSTQWVLSNGRKPIPLL